MAHTFVDYTFDYTWLSRHQKQARIRVFGGVVSAVDDHGLGF